MSSPKAISKEKQFDWPLCRYRRVLLSEEDGARLEAVERRGYRGYIPARPAGEVEGLLKAAELWRTRPRRFQNDAEAFRHAHGLLDRLLELVGPDLACY